MLPINLIPVHAVKSDYYNCGEYEYRLAVPLHSRVKVLAAGGPYVFSSEFYYKLTLAKISFASKKVDDEAWKQAPKTFTIVGSHDCISAWDTLREVTNGFTGGGQTKSWNIPCESQKLYQCYGIKSSVPRFSDYFTNFQMTSKTNAPR